MKLSEKGMLKLRSFVPIMNNFNVTTEDIEFEPDDFESCVVLTVMEAKELANKLQQNANFFFLQTDEFDYDTDDLRQCLTDKIEQAEGK